MNLTILCQHLRNWFVRSGADRHIGEFTVKDGTIELPFLNDGQYFRIMRSVHNDGVHRYPASGLKDEVFRGEIQAMAVPGDVLQLVDDITAWEAKYLSAAESPFSSESFGGYSYTKSAGFASDAQRGITWQGAFRSRLNAWRKL